MIRFDPGVSRIHTSRTTAWEGGGEYNGAWIAAVSVNALQWWRFVDNPVGSCWKI